MPFPYERLPRVPRDSLGLARLARRQLGPGREAWGRWTDWLGQEAAAPRVLGVRRVPGGELPALLQLACQVIGLQAPGGQQGLLALDGKLVAMLLSALLKTGPAPVAETVSEAERGLLLYLLAALLHELGQGCRWSLAAGTPHIPEEGSWLVVELGVLLGERCGSVHLVLPDAPMLAAAAPVPANLARLELVDCAVPVVLARMKLPMVELELLGQGDVILSPAVLSSSAVLSGWLAVGEARIAVTISDGQVRVSAPLRLGGEPMDDEQTEEVMVAAEGLPVEITVELGRLRLTAAQLVELDVGDVLTLGRPTISTVDLRVGDRLMGRAELVDVEGEGGVRLVEVYG